MKTRDGSMRALRTAHAIQDDTKVFCVEGDAGPQYSGGPNQEAVIHVGINWILKHYPEAFVEITADRLIRPHKT